MHRTLAAAALAVFATQAHAVSFLSGNGSGTLAPEVLGGTTVDFGLQPDGTFQSTTVDGLQINIREGDNSTPTTAQFSGGMLNTTTAEIAVYIEFIFPEVVRNFALTVHVFDQNWILQTFNDDGGPGGGSTFTSDNSPREDRYVGYRSDDVDPGFRRFYFVNTAGANDDVFTDDPVYISDITWVTEDPGDNSPGTIPLPAGDAPS